MKYMGSKRSLIDNGLGTLISESAESSTRFVDLFCGASSVAWFAAHQLHKQVLACDLQEYAVVLSSSVIERSQPVERNSIEADWIGRTREVLKALGPWKQAVDLDSKNLEIHPWHSLAQQLCKAYQADLSLLVFRCYGGYYFSPSQALAFDAMLQALPADRHHKKLCLAAVIIAASNCVASPGHTAQPFKATATAGRYLREAWLRDPFLYVSKALQRLCPLYSQEPGQAYVGDANQVAHKLSSDDLVFVDPPYSAVHYSRFYHVLETMARGTCATVSGEGRYPPPSDRPTSLYSQKSKSKKAITELLATLSANGCRAIVTFPGKQCSNGLSGEEIESIARECFRVDRKSIRSKFSTLGGNKVHRTARHQFEEYILMLTAR